MIVGGGPSAARVQLFGRARVCVAEAEIALSPLQLMLVALVYGHEPGGVDRSTAIRLLWGIPSSQRGRHRLRQLLCDVHGRVGRGIIDTPGDALLPESEGGSDLRMFASALADGPLRDAATHLSRGFVQAPFTPPEPFEEWRDQKSQCLLRDLRTQALAKWAISSERGDWCAARDAAEALYALEIDAPEVVERVIEARARAGEFPSAEEAFARYLAGLPPGSSPSSEVTATIDRMRELESVGRSGDPVLGLDEPFVGRREALWIARAAVDSVSKGAFELVLFSGESGIGKTRVLDEVHREALLKGLRCLRAQPVELERNIPLNPLLDALGDVDLSPHLDAIGQPWSSVIESLLPHGMLDRSAEEPPPISAASLSRRLLESFSLLLERLARERPTLLIIDDLQWADATTVTALQFLQRRWSHGALGVVVTVRPELVQPDDPVSKYLTAAAGLEVRHVELSVLDPSEALELVDRISESRVGRTQAERLCEIAGCHPLYLTELTRELLAGRLALPERTSDPVAIPTSLGQMLDARLEALDDNAMLIAGVLAVAGKPLRLPEIARLGDLSLPDTASATDDLARERFVAADGDRVCIAHELFRSAVYRHLSGPRRALHHRAIAGHLASNAESDHVGELAIHYARAGEDQLAAEYGWTAAKRAMDAGAIAEAVHLFEIVAENEQDAARRADATAALANALHLSRDITRANPQLRLAAEQLRSTGRPDAARRLDIKRVEGLAEVGAASVSDLLAELRTIKARAHEAEDWESVALSLDAELHLLHRGGDVEQIPDLISEMKDLTHKRSLSAQVLAYAGLALGVFFGEPVQAQEAAEKAVELSDNCRQYKLHALSRLMIVLQARGRLTQPDATDLIAEARAAAEKSGDVLLRFNIESNLAVAYLDSGDVDRAEALMSGVPSRATGAEMDINRFVQSNNEAELALARMDYESAAAAFSRATSYLGLTTPSYMRDIVNAGLGLCALQTGDLAEARQRDTHLRVPNGAWYFDPTTILAFRSRLLEVRGERDAAARLLKEAIEDLEGRFPLAALKVGLLLVRLLSKSAPMAARELAGEMRSTARGLGLTSRAAEFEAMLARLS